MTKKEISAFTKRIAAKVARGELSSRPLSQSQKLRAQEILRRHAKQDNEEKTRVALRA